MFLVAQLMIVFAVAHFWQRRRRNKKEAAAAVAGAAVSAFNPYSQRR